MERPKLDGVENKIVDYIDYLEGRGVEKLQLALMQLCDVLADDVENAISGKKKLKILASDNKIFQNFLALVKNKKDFFELSLPVAGETKAGNPEAEPVKTTGNAFEDTSKRIKNKINGTR